MSLIIEGLLARAFSMSHEPTLTVWMYYFGLFILCSTESHRGRIVCASIAYETGKQRAHGCSLCISLKIYAHSSVVLVVAVHST